MNVGIYQGAAAIGAMERWQAAISQNIAAATVPGYKGSDIAISGESFGQIQARIDGKGGSTTASVPVDRNNVSFLPGQMTRTGNPTDVALSGKGFFVVQEADGRLRYTRNGEFGVNTQNQLVSSDGNLVQGTGGTISLLPSGGEISISDSGQIYQGNTPVGKLRVVDFADTGGLTKVSGGFYAAGASVPNNVESSSMTQGYLEGSNVSAIDEMVKLIQATRAQEANQKVITSYDKRLGSAIQTFTN